MLTNAKGFTLLEFIIAIALLVFILTTAYLSQSSSLVSSTRTKNLMIATTLARNLMAESETKFDQQKFEIISKEEKGKFSEPHTNFTWKREVKEVDFTALADLMASSMKPKDQSGVTEQQNMVVKLFQEYLKNSVRKMTVTIEWPEGNASGSIAFSSLLVNYDADFAAGL